jgi:hypothetical protein
MLLILIISVFSVIKSDNGETEEITIYDARASSLIGKTL